MHQDIYKDQDECLFGVLMARGRKRFEKKTPELKPLVQSLGSGPSFYWTVVCTVYCVFLFLDLSGSSSSHHEAEQHF